MAIETSNVIHAAASVIADPATVVFRSNRGFSVAASVKGGVGLYDLFLDAPVPATECVIHATQHGGAVANATFGVVHLSDTVKEIQTLDAGILSDAIDFDVAIVRHVH